MKDYLQNDEFWMELHKKEVSIDGIIHVLNVSVFTAIYPYKHDVISVMAEPKDKTTKYYRDEKRRLGDDWSIDVLESFDLLCDIMKQFKK